MKYNALRYEVGRALVAKFLFCYFACTAEETFFNFSIKGMVAFHVCFLFVICCKFITNFFNMFLKFLSDD